jgi:hypothetical protein
MVPVAMGLSLSEEERQMLFDVLNGMLPSLREEVYKTDNYDYRKQLQRKEEILKALLPRLDPGVTRSL